MWSEVFHSFLSIALELTILFIGISFLINLLQGVIPYEKMERLMEKSHPLVSALVALGFAFITPFCSCSTIPVVVNLLNKKVRFGIVMIFLFSSPVLDPTIITLMTAVLGAKVAISYTFITGILSVIIGFALEKFGFEEQIKNVVVKGYQEPNKKFQLKVALLETLQLMKSVYPYLLIGAFIGAFIHGAVPTSWISTFMGGDKWWLVPIAAIVGIPLYIRLSTMIPISQIMIAKGMALGPVMALMISSAGASLPELTLLNSIFKKKLVFAFVGSVITMSTISGFLFYII
ncbi:permease [Neobacillus sp. MM2021_6]|uniref:permease n=1 Tax=Bacillaceae TaxID=186817 RepID=UPI00140D4C10|nr:MULTISPECIES: permease [Bacillaceae]MBO0959963.1 permease [Neobacillus sp. MM2021_6]NHC18715.1 permease [Bacillus sp. MM2020_4]